MIRVFVGAIALGLGCAGIASAQEGGASGAVVQPPDQVIVRGKQKPQPDLSGLAAMMIDYPPRALRRREEGDVKLAMCVNEKGRVHDIKLLESSGSEALDEASLKGIPRLKFRPGQDADGKPTDWCDPPYVFTVAWRLPPR